MKNIIRLLVLILSVAVILTSCSEEEEESTTPAASSENSSGDTDSGGDTTTSISVCSSTASGTITGIDNQSLSGTYNIMKQYPVDGMDNSTGCTSSLTLLSTFSSYIATGAGSFIYYRVITSSTSFATVLKSYTDSACSSEMASLVIGNNNVSVGDNVTGLTTGSGSIGTTGTKVTSVDYCMAGKGTTDNGTAWLNSYVGGDTTFTTGEEKIAQSSGAKKYHLWHTDNSSKRINSSLSGYENYSGNVWRDRASSSSYPTDWTDMDGGSLDGFQDN